MPPNLWLHLDVKQKIHVQPLVIPMRLGWLKYGRSSMVHYQVVRSPSLISMKVYPSTKTCIEMCKWHRFLNIWAFTPKVFFPVCNRNICLGWLELHTVWGETSVLLEIPAGSTVSHYWETVCVPTPKKYLKWVIPLSHRHPHHWSSQFPTIQSRRAMQLKKIKSWQWHLVAHGVPVRFGVFV